MNHVFTLTDINGNKYRGRGKDTIDAAFRLIISISEHYKLTEHLLDNVRQLCHGDVTYLSSLDGWTLEAGRYN